MPPPPRLLSASPLYLPLPSVHPCLHPLLCSPAHAWWRSPVYVRYSSMVYCDGCLSVIPSDRFPTIGFQNIWVFLWNKVSKCDTHNHCSVQTDWTETQTSATPGVRVSSSPVSVEAVKRDPAVLGPGYIPGHLFVCWCMIFQCLCSCSASSPPLPGLALFSVSLCEVVSCDDENFSLPESL